MIPEKPFALDEVYLQIPKKLYTKLATAAENIGISLDSYVFETVENSEN